MPGRDKIMPEKIGQKLNQKFRQWMKDPKFLRAAVIVGIGAILIIFIMAITPKKETETAVTSDTDTVSFSEDYAARVEKRLSELLSKIKGVGDADVMVTVGSSEEYVYATDNKKNGDSSIVVYDGGKKALTGRVNAPRITGVVIVCEGGDDSRTVEKIYSAVSAACNLGPSRIYVTKSR
jgi:stage III sporulation protein AG